MKAHFRTDDGTPLGVIEPTTLEDNGVLYASLSLEPSVYQPVLDDLRTRRGYVTQDEVKLHPTMPNLDAALRKFDPEHLHEDDEVRFVLEGSGIFDIRSNDDRWMRVLIEPGDLILVPRGKNHRFELTPERHIRCVRLFKDPAGWVPVYRGGGPSP